MALGKYNRRTVMADTGAVIAGATVTFYNQLTGLPVTAYDDPGGMDPLGSSIESGPDGEVEVFLPPGKYRITTELGSYSDEITYEPIVGDLAVIDATDVTNGLFLLDVPAETSFIRVLANGYSDLRTTAQVKIDLGLENVNNTSDANKPISIATQAALDFKADKATVITAGTGLTGGGDLSANRTLDVDFGTTTGTVAEGNDARLSDAREWNAATVTQVEVEAGTATTRRAWTAQRVRQAIVAWWNTVGTTVGKNILTLSNPGAERFLRINADNTATARSSSEMRTDLGLGTAASADLTTSTSDMTTGRVLKVGDFNIGAEATLESGIDLNTKTTPGHYLIAVTDQTNGPENNTLTGIMDVLLVNIGGVTRVLQKFHAFNTDQMGRVFIRFRSNATTWQPWQEQYSSNTYSIVPVENGGTGATDAATARTNLGLNESVPSGPTATGEPGQTAGDADYIYRCIATDTWIRVPKDASWT